MQTGDGKGRKIQKVDIFSAAGNVSCSLTLLLVFNKITSSM